MAMARITLVDAARQHFKRCARSPNTTRKARHAALDLMRECEEELAVLNGGSAVVEAAPEEFSQAA